TMADVNVNVPAKQAPAMAPPTRTDEQILPRIRGVPIGKRNCYLEAERIVGGYKCQLDKQWFDLTKETLRDALQITPVNNNKVFSSPPTPDTLIQFVNDLGYLKEVRHLSNVVTNDMFQQLRELVTIINLCLTGKTSRFERPRAPVLQILWGVINRAHIDYAERMWEEFTQSIHTFTEDKKNLAQQTQGKKKATLIVIPSVRFTKLIIFHLQRKHNFHPRPESPLHLPTEEPALGYLKFSAKETKREVFGMPIPNDLIADDIRGAQYYDAFLEKVAKHQRYLAGEEVSNPDSPAPKPAKPTKLKATKQVKPVAPKAATKKPKPALAKPQDKKRKPVSETSEAPPPTKRPKTGKVIKKQTLKSSQQLVDEFVDEGVPLTEPRFGDTQRAIEESLKEAHGAHRGPLPPVVFKETNLGRLQPLPDVQGKGKEKAGEEQAAQVLLNLQTLKKKSSAEYDTESDEEVPPIVKSGAQDEGKAGPNPGKQDEGQAGLNPGNDTVSQPHQLVILFSIHNDEWKSFQCHHQTALRGSINRVPTDDDTIADEQAYSSGAEDIGHDHIPTASALKSTYAPPPENLLLAQIDDMATFMDCYCKKQGIYELTQKDLEGLAYEIVKVFHPDIGRPALSISKMKAAHYLNAGLEQMVPGQMWIEEECKYDIAVINLVIRQHVEDFQLGIESYQTQLNLTKPRWDATGFEYKHDFTVIDSPRAVTFRDKYGVQMIMSFNEIHKFSDGTLQQINEALDYRVKEFRVNRMNSGLDTRFWMKKDVDRSKEFMFAIQKRLKTRRILRNLESFVGGRIREGDYRLLKRTE
ncbi:hypothetical protein Tco_1093519, partial [Tanacetum coccineum]